MRYRSMLLILAALVFCSCGRSEPQPAMTKTGTKISDPRVATGRAEAQRIAAKPWSIEDLAVTDDFLMTLTLRQLQDGERIVFHVDPSHLGWHRYTVLQKEAVGAIVRFEYRESSYDESDSPQRILMPEYHLVPVVTVSGKGESFLERQIKALK